jgi:hypothetical protein
MKELYKDEAWLRKKYWDEQKSTGEMAREYEKIDPSKPDWTIEGTIRSWMIKHRIPRRTRSQATTLAHRRAGHKSRAERIREKIIAKLEKTSQQLWDLAEEIREMK